MRVRLTRRLAEQFNGVDLSSRRVGDLLDLPQRDADMLVGEGWATLVDRDSNRSARAMRGMTAADRSTHRKPKSRT